MKTTEIESKNLKTLEDHIAGPPTPTIDERLEFVTSYLGENNSTLTSAGSSTEVLRLLSTGLSVEEKNQLLAKLVDAEWDRAINSDDPNTFMRSNSLYKTALVASFPVTEEQFRELCDNPLGAVEGFKIPDHLVPVAQKIAEKNPSMILFSMMLGPILLYQNKRVEEARKDLEVARKALKDGQAKGLQGDALEVLQKAVKDHESNVEEAEHSHKEAAKGATQVTTIYRALSSGRSEQVQDKIGGKEVMEAYRDALHNLTVKLSEANSEMVDRNFVASDQTKINAKENRFIKQPIPTTGPTDESKVTDQTVSKPTGDSFKSKVQSFFKAVGEFFKNLGSKIAESFSKSTANKNQGSTTEFKSSESSSSPDSATPSSSSDKPEKTTSFAKTVVALLTGGSKATSSVMMDVQKQLIEVLNKRNQEQEQKEEQKQGQEQSQEPSQIQGVNSEEKKSTGSTDGFEKVGRSWQRAEPNKGPSQTVTSEDSSVSQQETKDEPPRLQ